MFRVARGANVPAIILFFAFAAGVASAAEDLRLEAEEFEAYGSYDLGGIPILVEYCASASGHYTADGIDVPGEWIKLKVSFVFEDDYRTELAYQAAYGDTVVMRATILDFPEPGQSVSTDYLLDNGYGFG